MSTNWSCSASSTSRQVHEFIVTRQIAFMMPAARNHQMFCENAQITAGTLHARISKIRVVRRRPSLSVIAPLMSAQKTWKPQLTLNTSPILRSVSPSASI